MAQKIFKYQLEVMDEQVIEIPNGAKILTIQTQNEKPCIWAMVNTESGMGKKKIVMFGTGHPIDSGKNIEYIGSFQVLNGQQIYHTFEEK